MAFRMKLGYSEYEYKTDMKYIAASSFRYTLPPEIFELSDLNRMLKSLLPDDAKLNFIFDEMRLRSNLSTNEKL